MGKLGDDGEAAEIENESEGGQDRDRNGRRADGAGLLSFFRLPRKTVDEKR